MITINEVLPPILAEEKIEIIGFIPFSECKIINQSLFDRKVDFVPKSVAVFAVPYYTGEHSKRNLSLYAVSRDYHLYFKNLYERVIAELKEKMPSRSFIGFADSSPIGETHAAAISGIGIIGDKYQLITEKYGSHVFIGEILTDAELSHTTFCEIKHCSHCGKCVSACPTKDGECYSSLNQKKGELSDTAKEIMLKTGIAWGCDICREVCPLNENAEKTPIDFFYRDNIEILTEETLENMSDEEFESRAYSFRGRKTILRNISFLASNRK